MSFQKLVSSAYPRRLWSLLGFPGWSRTFAMQMRGPLLCIDADHRADEVVRLAANGIYQLSDQPADNVAAEAIADCLARHVRLRHQDHPCRLAHGHHGAPGHGGHPRQ